MNTAVWRYSADNHIGTMGTTLAMMAFGTKSAYACNLGDSRIYHMFGGEFHQVSTDHVLRSGLFGKAPLTQYLGMEDGEIALEPSLVELELREDSRYLICSDGVTDMLTDGEIAEILNRNAPVGEILEILLEEAMEKGGRDNTTAILCQIEMQEEKNPIKTWLQQLKKDRTVMCNEEPDAGSGF